MTIKYVIHFSHGQFCNCFSETDLERNLRFAFKEGYRVLGVEAA